MPLTVNIDKKNVECVTLSPSGSIDTNTSIILDKAVDSVLQLKPKVIVLDMKDVDYMSSAGVRVIIKAKKGIEALGGILTIVNLQPQIKKVFDIINALPSLQIFGSIQELDDYLTLMQKKDLGQE
ncbi:MAG: STAS domain-containing protein [Candidatus Omnitrophica bacterium]|nr:STAS domain-containing protein [Candidatus Omnitrophota bacterium]